MIERHHHRHQPDERAGLAEAAEHAGFDLGTDVAQPVAGHEHTAFDAETDLGVDGEPPELRD
ncbi:hypothetical protein [Amycolatopsis sp. FDAARGOS 1241]|uniref:hypothetical protein n=1 Tax=Amycolatopsis sp. FDAARGOS 1241 TaxID=2778070 RepID=UPI00194F78B7|nr:hypothetical protein [Amycolatopsis sp. FDAARGOS 1241]QRP49318.1 hypothetical protein I6J71_17030 [Amycolatopsis sp. FDAARGOS 1241]